MSIEIKPTTIQQVKANKVPKQYKQIAEGMETQFAKMMLDQMRKTVAKSDQSSASNYYDDVLSYERAKMMTKGEGLGIQKLILEQILPSRYKNNITINKPSQQTANKERMNSYQNNLGKGVANE